MKRKITKKEATDNAKVEFEAFRSKIEEITTELFESLEGIEMGNVPVSQMFLHPKVRQLEIYNTTEEYITYTVKRIRAYMVKNSINWEMNKEEE